MKHTVFQNAEEVKPSPNPEFTPSPSNGEASWDSSFIYIGGDAMINGRKCNRCGFGEGPFNPVYKFCPGCGAKMRNGG